MNKPFQPPFLNPRTLLDDMLQRILGPLVLPPRIGKHDLTSTGANQFLQRPPPRVRVPAPLPQDGK
jgi:hypothetical protein